MAQGAPQSPIDDIANEIDRPLVDSVSIPTPLDDTIKALPQNLSDDTIDELAIRAIKLQSLHGTSVIVRASGHVKLTMTQSLPF